MGATLPTREGVSLEPLSSSPCFSATDGVKDLLGISDLDLFKKGSLLQPAPAAKVDNPVELDRESGIPDGTDSSENKTGLFLIGTPETGSTNRSPSG